MKTFSRLPVFLLALLFLGTILVWYTAVNEGRRTLRVSFLDVGQGDAIFIESPTGTQALLDGGPDRKVLRELSKLMPFYDRSIDLLIVSNPDKDHFAGFADVLRSYKVERVLEPGTLGKSGEYPVFVELVKKEPAERITALRGQRIDLGGGAKLLILFPDRDVSLLDTNDGSIVAKLIYGNTSFLLTGDTTEPVEEYLAALDGAHLDADVLKIGHHGSKTSTSEALLGFASPSVAIISAGKDNRYGHPHKEVVDRLNEFEVETLGTYEHGTIIMESDGETIKVKK